MVRVRSVVMLLLSESACLPGYRLNLPIMLTSSGLTSLHLIIARSQDLLPENPKDFRSGVETARLLGV